MILVFAVVVLLLACVLSLNLLVGLIVTLVPTTIIYFGLALLGVSIAFWHLFIIVFLAIFIFNLLFN